MLYAYQLHISVIRSVAEIPGSIEELAKVYDGIIVWIHTHLVLAPDSRVLPKTVLGPTTLEATPECNHSGNDQSYVPIVHHS